MTATAPGLSASSVSAIKDGEHGKASRKESFSALLYLLPSLIGVLIFLAIPIVVVVVLSFFRWNLLNPARFVGGSNYFDIFKYDGMGHALLVTCYYVILNIPAQTVFALLLAILLNRRLPATGFIRVIAVLPYLATPVAMALVWNWFFDPTTGVINTVLGMVGITGPAWLSSQAWAMPVVAWANIWQYVGYNMLFFMAGLQAVPHDLYEAASIDGAGNFKRFFSITLPLLRPTLLFVLVTGVIGSFQVFDTVYVMTNGGPGNATEVVNPLIYKTAFVGFRIGEASAMSVVLFIVILAVTILQFAYFNKRTTYEMT